MTFYGITDATTLATYLSGDLVKFAGNNTTGVNQVITQRYIAFAQNSGMEAWFNQRRTGVPVFLTGVGTGNQGVMPKRWQYPSSELTTNGTNLTTALKSQYSGNDNINDLMWLLK